MSVATLIIYTVPEAAFATRAELNSCNRNHMAHEATDIHYLDLYGKSVPTPGLDLHLLGQEEDQNEGKANTPFSLDLF